MDEAKSYLDGAKKIALDAGRAILEIYHSADDLQIKTKADSTPLTIADLRAHEIIKQGLAELTPSIPLLSEEGAQIDFAKRASWDRYWLVDPLDGTKEFVHRTNEFTVNIALIENHVPVLGVVYVPVSARCYFAAESVGAFREDEVNAPEAIHVVPWQDGVVRIAASRRHNVADLQKQLSKLGEHEIIPMGSALKICIVAEGGADLYPRFGPTSEWDTAAGQCVLEQAGGFLTDLEGKRFEYNRKAALLNGPFLAFGDRYLFDERITHTTNQRSNNDGE